MKRWLRGSGRALLAVAACYTLRDVRNEGCRMYCVQQGYRTGRAAGPKLNKCECIDLTDYENGEPLSLGVPGAALGEVPETHQHGWFTRPVD